MFAIRARRKVATERDFLDAVEKVVRQGTKFSSTWVLLLYTVRLCLIPGIGLCIRYITEVEYIVITFGFKISYMLSVRQRLCVDTHKHSEYSRTGIPTGSSSHGQSEPRLLAPFYLYG